MAPQELPLDPPLHLPKLPAVSHAIIMCGNSIHLSSLLHIATYTNAYTVLSVNRIPRTTINIYGYYYILCMLQKAYNVLAIATSFL